MKHQPPRWHLVHHSYRWCDSTGTQQEGSGCDVKVGSNRVIDFVYFLLAIVWSRGNVIWHLVELTAGRGLLYLYYNTEIIPWVSLPFHNTSNKSIVYSPLGKGDTKETILFRTVPDGVYPNVKYKFLISPEIWLKGAYYYLLPIYGAAIEQWTERWTSFILQW